MPKLLPVGTNGGQSSAVSGQKKSGLEKTTKEEMREMLDQVKPKALRERLLRVWAKW